ncbi:MAG: hypothetical protein ABI165_11375, partial [Bryobacteraceae bacterium]
MKRRRSAIVGLAALAASILVLAQSPANLLQNPGFENQLPGGWTTVPATASYGLIYRSEAMVHGGKYSLRLFPTSVNTSPLAAGNLGVTQTLAIQPYLGKPLYFSAWMDVRGPVTALVRLIGLTSGGDLYFRQLKQDAQTPAMVFHRDILDLPNDPTLIALFVSCSVQGADGVATFDDVTVSNDPSLTNWPMGQPDPGPPLEATVVIRTDQTVRRVPASMFGMNLEWVS